MKSESESRSVVSNSSQPHGLYTVHGILQARILEWVAFLFSRESSQPWAETPVSPALQADSLPTELSGKPNRRIYRFSDGITDSVDMNLSTLQVTAGDREA